MGVEGGDSYQVDDRRWMICNSGEGNGHAGHVQADERPFYLSLVKGAQGGVAPQPRHIINAILKVKP